MRNYDLIELDAVKMYGRAELFYSIWAIFNQYSVIFSWHPDEVNNKRHKNVLKDKWKKYQYTITYV